ncbi:Glu/Leu/Phe/Val dehydrogenase dimerization domain-containing protein [Sphaerimonospora thailandensis]|uniref:Amino acid dehydrogenase n=1 Tax=Sphaerimonospora thailandensis TaxID=795644 RepID=A0A8J3RAF2_9ACTN|nr:Glu/Leu/Phe/Val dehydrogenase dimerization domain-containing protein [Sphaerimonospora thailandensis]GIH70716.1 amino acid dehydrogenase [Sphaerimonospora thailandensis]
MKHLLTQFENKAPEIVFEWHDAETPARGWVVINSLRGGAAGGGTRMRPGLDRDEVVSLAKTMEIKFTVSGPRIGGAKSGIDFDPRDPRKNDVLRRWYTAVTPLLKTYYGTGGDLNVDEMQEVVPITESLGLWHPQEGVVRGHFDARDRELVGRVGQLRLGVAKVVADPRLTPDPAGRHSVADLITGWGVAQSVRHYYAVYGGDIAGKRVIVQGWGNVGSAAAYYAAQSGARVVGVIDRDGGIVNPAGYGFDEIRELFLAKDGNTLRADGLVPYAEIDEAIWDVGAEVFLPCAASRLVTRDQVDRMTTRGLEVIACGANVPFADPEIFYGQTYEHADKSVAVVPDFIANSGMARTFALLMRDGVEITDQAIFSDISATIESALRRCHESSPARTGVASTAFEIALDQLV